MKRSQIVYLLSYFLNNKLILLRTTLFYSKDSLNVQILEILLSLKITKYQKTDSLPSSFIMHFQPLPLDFTKVQNRFIPKTLRKPQNATFVQTRRVVPKAQAASVVPYGRFSFVRCVGKRKLLMSWSSSYGFYREFTPFVISFRALLSVSAFPPGTKGPRECKLMFHSPLCCLFQ